MCVFNNTFDHFGTINNFKLMSDQITREPDVNVKIVKESKTDIKVCFVPKFRKNKFVCFKSNNGNKFTRYFNYFNLSMFPRFIQTPSDSVRTIYS